MNNPRILQKIIGKLSTNWPWIARKLNKIAINKCIDVARHRPHPWSTVHDYVSWTSLTDQTWSARHLPAKRLTPPKKDNVHEFFARETERRSAKSTCLFPSFAQYLTDGVIRTRMPESNEPPDPKRKQNTSNHQLDLSPLYGRTTEQTAVLRRLSSKPGEKGRLKSQDIGGGEYAPFLYDGASPRPLFACLDHPLMSERFKEKSEIISRLFAFGGDRANAAPQIAMINTLFLREHNRLAGIIEAAHPGWDDEHVFQVARNINIVLFIKIVVEEYINHIAPSPVFLTDPSVAWNAPWNKPNWLTTEFSLLYRWHSLIPDVLKWGEAEYPVAETIMNNGILLDVGLGDAFASMSRQRAGEIGAFNTAVALLDFEKAAIDQGRLCQLASYSDYREYLSLRRPRKFTDVSSVPRVRQFLADAYATVDDIEFYVGLFAEDLDGNSPLPPMLRAFVALDAFSQAFTNPLLSEHVWNEETFTREGWGIIHETSSIRNVLDRNIDGGLGEGVFIGMTNPEWKGS